MHTSYLIISVESTTSSLEKDSRSSSLKSYRTKPGSTNYLGCVSSPWKSRLSTSCSESKSNRIKWSVALIWITFERPATRGLLFFAWSILMPCYHVSANNQFLVGTNFKSLTVRGCDKSSVTSLTSDSLKKTNVSSFNWSTR